jgi:putative ABC transport system permease protein
VLASLTAAPAVNAAAASFTAPLGGVPNRGITIEGLPEPEPGQEPSADFQAITPDFFRTLGITLLDGRGFTAADDDRGQPVAIVNRAFAEKYLRARGAVGSVVRFGGDRRHLVVGVAANARYRQVERAAEPAVFVPLAQNDEPWPFLAVTVWADGDPAAAASLLRGAFAAGDPSQPISRVRTFEELLVGQLAPRRFTTWLVGLFGVLALLLAAIGAYGVMSLSVATRRREIGVRSALGASAASLRGLVLGEAAVLAALAAGLGLALAVSAGRVGRSLLFEVSATDPALLAGGAGFVIGVAMLAAYLPARRAARTNPLEALRAE